MYVKLIDDFDLYTVRDSFSDKTALQDNTIRPFE